jgi:hypothetical protein
VKVVYRGPHAEVEIAATGDFVRNGETVEVPEEVGKSLCEQDTWEPAPSKKEKAE